MQPIIDELDNTITCYNMKNNSYIQNLYDAEYWQSKASYVGLTREEHDYVIDHPIIHVGYLKIHIHCSIRMMREDSGNFQKIF